MTALIGLPDVLPVEAPSSWLTRAALALGVELKELLDYLGMPRRADPDVAFLSERYPEYARLCGLQSNDFAIARHLLQSIRRSRVHRSFLLLPADGGRARYRACPLCLDQQRTPYAPIHCRFSVWRFCPEHDCLLEDACWSCKAEIRLPVSLLSQGVRAREVAYVSQCFECGWSHSKSPSINLARCSTVFSSMEMLLLNHGRATLAALMWGKVVFGEGEPQPITMLRRIQRMGLIATSAAGPSAKLWRRRVEVDEAKDA
jgi:hypothetical protein